MRLFTLLSIIWLAAACANSSTTAPQATSSTTQAQGDPAASAETDPAAPAEADPASTAQVGDPATPQAADDPRCPAPDTPCMNADNHAQCLAIAATCKGRIELLKSCPYQFACGD